MALQFKAHVFVLHKAIDNTYGFPKKIYCNDQNKNKYLLIFFGFFPFNFQNFFDTKYDVAE